MSLEQIKLVSLVIGLTLVSGLGDAWDLSMRPISGKAAS